MIWICTVCKDRVYLGSARLGLKVDPNIQKSIDYIEKFIQSIHFCFDTKKLFS